MGLFFKEFHMSIYEIDQAQPHFSFKADSVFSLGIISNISPCKSLDNVIMATSCSNKIMKIGINPREQTVKWSHQGHETGAYFVEVSPSGHYVLSGGYKEVHDLVLCREVDGIILSKIRPQSESGIFRNLGGFFFSPFSESKIICFGFDSVFLLEIDASNELKAKKTLVSKEEIGNVDILQVTAYESKSAMAERPAVNLVIRTQNGIFKRSTPSF